MRCEDARRRSALFVEGGLREQEEAAFREHISQCAACRAEVVQRDPSRLFVVLGKERTPEGFWHGFIPPIRASMRPRRPFPALLRRLEPALAAGLVLAVTVSAFFAGRTLVRRGAFGARGLEVAGDPGRMAGGDLSPAVLRTLEQRYSVSSYLAVSNPGAEVIDLTYDAETEAEGGLYRFAMILDEKLEESF